MERVKASALQRFVRPFGTPAFSLLVIVLLGASLAAGVGFWGLQSAEGQNWKAEFDDICSRTSDAMSLTKEELKNLIERCDKLKPLIEALEETQKKVYLKRLQLCRDLLVFTLESKEKN